MNKQEHQLNPVTFQNKGLVLAEMIMELNQSKDLEKSGPVSQKLKILTSQNLKGCHKSVLFKVRGYTQLDGESCPEGQMSSSSSTWKKAKSSVEENAEIFKRRYGNFLLLSNHINFQFYQNIMHFYKVIISRKMTWLFQKLKVSEEYGYFKMNQNSYCP